MGKVRLVGALQEFLPASMIEEIQNGTISAEERLKALDTIYEQGSKRVMELKAAAKK